MVIDVDGWLRPPQQLTRKFSYDPAPVRLPLSVDWSQSQLDVQDGEWEKTEVDGQVPDPMRSVYHGLAIWFAVV